MAGPILVVNAGSSSLKFELFEPWGEGALRSSMEGQLSGIGTRPHLKARDAAGKTLVDESFAPASIPKISTYVVPTDEELMIAHHTQALVGGSGRKGA